MSRLYLQALWQILRFEYLTSRRDFQELYRHVKSSALSASPPAPYAIDHICRAVDVVCLWYPKPVLCLQRSAATACLLKRYGLPAQMVIGVQQLPFRAHSWVEVEGRVVNDKFYIRDKYTVLDCC